MKRHLDKKGRDETEKVVPDFGDKKDFIKPEKVAAPINLEHSPDPPIKGAIPVNPAS